MLCLNFYCQQVSLLLLQLSFQHKPALGKNKEFPEYIPVEVSKQSSWCSSGGSSPDVTESVFQLATIAVIENTHFIHASFNLIHLNHLDF